MSILDLLSDKAVWQSFLSEKTAKKRLTKAEQNALSAFIEDEGYFDCAEKIKKGVPYDFPTKKLINKLGKEKKRVVYSFAEDENYVLKLISHLLYRYDDFYCPNCFSFRNNFGVKRAISTIVAHRDIADRYCYKVDISDYFNSMDCGILLSKLKTVLKDDRPLYDFFAQLLTADKCYSNGELIEEKRGAMAGTPVSPFFANVYLTELDRLFYNELIPYARYSDDIIVFAKTKEELDRLICRINGELDALHLKINPSKAAVVKPHEAWDFLGISFCDGVIDISPTTKRKMKGKIRRKSHSLYRWRSKKDIPVEKAVRLMVKIYNFKFFGKLTEDGEDFLANELTWSRWFFPLLTTDNGLREIDAYMQQELRYLASGKHNKKNFGLLPYDTLKEYGYISLVNRYYKWKEETKNSQP